MHADANSEGFRLLRREPSLFLMELLWRWCFGLGLLAIAFFAYTHFRRVILITHADLEVLDSGDPLAIATALAHVIAASHAVLLRACGTVSALAAVLWVAVHAPGRGVLTRVITRRFAEDYRLVLAPNSPRLIHFVLLDVFRVLMLLILLIGYVGGALIAVRVNPEHPNLLIDALIIFASFAVSVLVWSWLNWVLSLAPIFVVRDGLGALDSIAAALGFIRRNSSHLVAIALWNGTQRGLAATAITLAGVATVFWRAHLGAWGADALLILETLAYLVISDYLLLVRLAAYSAVSVRELKLRVTASETAGG